MKLLELNVRDFRNIQNLLIEPAPGVNLFWGENAQGKTNLLEAIYYLVTGRSFRSRQDKEVLPWNCEPDMVSAVRGSVQTEHSKYSIVVAVAKNQKKVSCNGKTLASLGLLWGKINAVLFTPDDLEIVKGPPGNRRRFMDMEGCQINLSYLHHLQRYAQILRQRNALLKSNMNELDLTDSLEIWDQQMITHAVEIFLFRSNFLETLSNAAGEIYSGIADLSEKLDLKYDNFLHRSDPGVGKAVLEAEYKKLLHKSRSEDIYRGSTSCGPHRDDFSIIIGGQDARTFASQGQQRSAIIALHLAEIDIIEKNTGNSPLLLLDDIVSELDEKRKSHFLSLLKPHHQTFITGTDAETLSGSLPVEKSFHIKNGNIV
jgi:DNA replication and repair protein RecF